VTAKREELEMNNKALATFVEEVLTDAERKFGPEPDRIWLEGYAREAVLNLWLEKPEITWFTAYKAHLLLRHAIAERTSDAGRDKRAGELSRIGECDCAGEGETGSNQLDADDRWFFEVA
jgi:hypothetical protein